MVSRCLSATGISLLGHPVPAEELGPPCGRLTGPWGPDLDGVTAFRTHELRSGWAPSVPRGQRCSSQTEATSRPGACRFAAASPCTPPHFPSTRISLNEASTKGSRVFARPIFPRLWPPGWNGPPLGIPRASHPADQEPDNARQGRDRPSSTDLELLAQLTSVDLQSGSSLVACDLASHVAEHSWARVVTAASQPGSSEKRPRNRGRRSLAPVLGPVLAIEGLRDRRLVDCESRGNLHRLNY